MPGLLLRESFGVSPTTVCECTATRSCRRNELLKSTKEVGRRSLERLFPQDSRRTAWCKPHLAEASLELDAKERETRRLRHTWSTHSSQTTMIQDAVTAGLLLQRPMKARLTQVIETATSTYLETLDDGDRATAKLYVQRRPRQQTKRGNKRSTGTPGAALRTQQCRNSNIPVGFSR